MQCTGAEGQIGCWQRGSGRESGTCASADNVQATTRNEGPIAARNLLLQQDGPPPSNLGDLCLAVSNYDGRYDGDGGKCNGNDDGCGGLPIVFTVLALVVFLKNKLVCRYFMGMEAPDRPPLEMQRDRVRPVLVSSWAHIPKHT